MKLYVEQYQTRGQGPWTDIYSLCATIYYCITGSLPTSAVDVFISVISSVNVSFEYLFAQVSVIGILQKRHDAGIMQGENPFAFHACFFSCFGSTGNQVFDYMFLAKE